MAKYKITALLIMAIPIGRKKINLSKTDIIDLKEIDRQLNSKNWFIKLFYKSDISFFKKLNVSRLKQGFQPAEITELYNNNVYLIEGFISEIRRVAYWSVR